MKQVYGIIYLLTNKVNGKKYVGQTRKSLRRRWRGHLRSSLLEKPLLLVDEAIKEFGSSNFSLRGLCHCYTFERLNYKEAFWINKLSSRSPHGYNVRSGGWGGSHATETREKQRSAKLGNKNPMFGKGGILSPTFGKPGGMLGKHQSIKTRKLISLATTGKNNSMFGVCGSDHPRFGKKHSESTKNKMKQAWTNKRRKEQSNRMKRRIS